MKGRAAPQPKTKVCFVLLGCHVVFERYIYLTLSKVVKTEDDEKFLAKLLGEVDVNVPSPVSRTSKRNRSPERRRPRVLSPVREARQPIAKRPRLSGETLPPPPQAEDSFADDDAIISAMDDDLPPNPATDVDMSDPAPLPSSPITKAVARKTETKVEPAEDDDEVDTMEVSHAGAINTASVNLSASRPIKKLAKVDPYPTPASSSPTKAPDPAVDSSSWNQLTDKLNVVSSLPEVRSVGKIDYKNAIEEDGSLNMFWTDYTEVNGSLCLFGKVLNKKTGAYVSCFVKVDNILRKLYFLPRQYRQKNGRDTGEEIAMMDVYSEVDEIMTRMKVDMHKIKACTRKYAFELPGIPKEGQYLKLLYPYTSESELTYL